MKEFEQPAEQQRSYHELREEFRAQHLADLRSRFGQRHRKGWNQIIDQLGRSEFTAQGWAMEMLARLDVPVTQRFGLDNVPEALGRKLEEQAQAAAQHDSVTWADGVEGVADRDAAPCNLSAMSDDEVCDYVATQIEASKKDG